MSFEFPPQPKKDNNEKKSTSDPLGNLKRATILTLGLMGMTAKSTAATESMNRDTETKTEKTIDKDSIENKSGLTLYIESKTPEGAITPTGMNNSFLENEQDLTLEELVAFAEREGFRTDNNKHFQEDLQKKYPEVVKKVLEKYGSTAADDFVDGMNGVRVKKVVETIQQQKTPPENKTVSETNPYERFGGMREPIYGPNHHIVAELWYPTAETNEADDAGTINTQKVVGLLRLRGDFGFNGKELLLNADQFQKYLGTTNTFQSEVLLQELVSLATPSKTAHYYDGMANNN